MTSLMLRCHDCKTTHVVPASLVEKDPFAKVYCHRCNVSRSYIFWIDLTDQQWAQDTLDEISEKQ